jgi:pimeloyl-ACP methyl ester carboxylesterase
VSEALQERPAAIRAVIREGVARASDGAKLHWRLAGAGSGKPFICSNGIGVGTFFWHFLEAHFSASRPVLTWDYRGHGLTPPPQNPEETTVERCARDLWTVADAAGIQETVLIGHSMGCQVSLEAIRLQPKRAVAFVPMLGAPGLTLTSFPLGDQLQPVIASALAILAKNPGLNELVLRTALKTPGLWTATRALGLIHPDLCPRDEFEPYFTHLRELDMRCYFALLQDLLTHDASDLLPGLGIPALVVAGSRDLFTPMSRSEEMARAIPDATLLVVRDGSHAALVEQPELIQLGLAKFLRRHQIDRGGV